MSATYVVRRVLLFFVVIWAATTFIFFLPKLAPGRNPIVERIGMMLATGGGVNAAGMQSMVDAYEAKFGLNKPLWQQYVTYLSDLSRADFGYSFEWNRPVLELLWDRLPLTFILALSTLLAVLSPVEPSSPPPTSPARSHPRTSTSPGEPPLGDNQEPD